MKTKTQEEEDIEFLSWNVYFPDEKFTKDDPRATLIRTLIEYFKIDRPKLEGKDFSMFLWLDFSTLNQRCGVESLLSLLIDHPSDTLASIACAAHEVAFETSGGVNVKIVPRIYNLDLFTPIRSLKANCLGKFVCVSGTVVRVSNIKPQVAEMSFTCGKCSAEIRKRFPDGKWTPPTRCPTSSCRSKRFIPDRTSALTFDWQKVRLQEIISDDQREAGRIPRTVEVELTQDLVDSCVPGDEVVVCGLVKVSTDNEKSRGRSRNKTMFLIYIDANSLTNSKQGSSGNKESLQFTKKDLLGIREIVSEPNLFHLIVNSLCPAIYGHEVVKAGLTLGLFGGCQRFSENLNKIPIRGDPHILVVGDPGLGKSQLLTAVSAVAPRGVYVGGNTTSTSGLTVTVVRDSSTGDYALEAGALVLGDQGCCCIDEFDKMGSEHQALLEAMEQQSISVAKAGIVCNLPARTSVIAAANPIGGHYNRAKTVSENLKMSPALLSRFDLVFILLDNPDEMRDQLLSEHVMKLHAGAKKSQKPSFNNFGYGKSDKSDPADASDLPLKERLKVNMAEFDPLPHPLLRKYIGYARKYVHPVLSSGASNILQEFYLDLRKSHQSADSTPITTRQLESMVRLAQARARTELREIVTEQDALDVVEIMKESLYDVLTNDMGQLDFTRTSGTSKTKETNRYIDRLTHISEQENKAIFTYAELYDVAQSIRLQVPNFENLIDTLNNQSYLLKRGPRVYKLQTSTLALTPSTGRKRSRDSVW